ncbi:hypothetical protein PR202_gb15041 [Eleusine coracana subsp. coracana]|uniref:Uncharacterized protein n=1 Tax=Eleusine coracana subsp. coracana TaxID=191504 RepID=A0AAV5EUI7_ELECO|nr:hypothetical protein PR202_gb15041 [Eleusine coracana subsp. coracana]
MHSLGLDSYRFSLSWSRILPKGRFGSINPAGVKFYNSLINDLLQKGIQPFVTLNHFDIPRELEDRYGSWLSSEMQEDYVYFAELCFKMFGDRVKHWATFNEPNLMAKLQYFSGKYPPNHCSRPFGKCAFGNSSTEPYIAAHNIILAHAKTADIYRKNYKGEKQLLRNQIDFIGINHYKTLYVKDCILSPCDLDTYNGDALVYELAERNGIPIGKPTPVANNYVVPTSMEKLVMNLKQRYNNTPMYITENGYAQIGNSSTPAEELINDTERLSYIRDYLTYLGYAIRLLHLSDLFIQYALQKE